MKDPDRNEATRRSRKLAAAPPPRGPHTVRASRLSEEADPATQVGEGFEGGLERRFRQIHSSVAGRPCSACLEDLAAPELNYRIVLRCTAVAHDV